MSKFSGVYLPKSELELGGLNEKAKKVDIKKLAKKLGITNSLVTIYLSTKEKYANIKVPQKFVDKLLEFYDETKKDNSEIATALNNKINAL